MAPATNGSGPEWSGPDWSMTDVLLVVVTYRGGPSLARCLQGLREQVWATTVGGPPPRLHVLVVDNGSTDQTRDVLAGEDVDVITPGSNLGFAAGANLGLRAGVRAWQEGSWNDGLLVLVNDDAVPAPDFVARMWQAHRSAPAEVAAFAGLLVHADDPGRVNSTGTVVTRRGSARDRDADAALVSLPVAEAVFGFCGGAAGLRPAALAEVGVFEDEWFLYYEDVDLSWRLRAHGWTVRHVRSALVRHELAASSGTASPVFRFHNDRNALTTFTRHAPASVVARMWLRFPVAVVWHALRQETRPLVPTRLRAGFAAAARLPRTLRERRRLWSGARVHRAEVARRWVDREV